jgi:flavin reductase (DIM6/NTAB) family NADH-FMN oxidoreductase RutF
MQIGVIMSLNEIAIGKLQMNPFDKISKEWMLITAEKEGKINTMTASWGGLGFLWNKNVAFIVVRPHRYTKEFLDASLTLSLSFYDDSYKKTLGYLGTVSGRDEEKIAKSGLTVVYGEEAPFFEEANLVLICKKLLAQPFNGDCFIDDSIIPNMYPNNDFHTMYIAEITKVLTK